MPEVLAVAYARNRIATALEDDDLEDAIDEEEAWLAERIGPLVGERVETFRPSAADDLVITRRASTVDVADDSGTVDVTLLGDRLLIRDDGQAWVGDVLVTYTPTDETVIRRALVDLVRLSVTETGFAGETTSSHTYRRDAAWVERIRRGLVASLIPKRAPHSVRLVSTVPTSTPRIEASQVASSGS